MLRYPGFILFLLFFQTGKAQRLISTEEAVHMAFGNQRNLKAANLLVKQQQQLLRGAGGLESPQLQYQVSPYDEGAQLGVQQTLSFPSVYRNRRALQQEMIRMAQLQLQGSQFDLKREVRLNYLQLQYYVQRNRLLRYQDSIYQAIKAASKRFFDAGQINKLEELQATTQADQITNDLVRNEAELSALHQLFRFYTGIQDPFLLEEMAADAFIPVLDNDIISIQQQMLQQQIAINQKELGLAKSEFLPELQAAMQVPTISENQRPIGYQLGLTIPIWRRQNRSRVAAAETSIELARAKQQLEEQRLYALYRQWVASFQRELQSLTYFNSTALPQARAIIETSQRLFQGGELNYIESLRNLQTAFEIFFKHLETHRAYNEAVIQLNYLNGNL